MDPESDIKCSSSVNIDAELANSEFRDKPARSVFFNNVKVDRIV
jgi:hypothetical protein